MIRHVVAFRWIPEATDEQVDALTAALQRLPARIPEVRSFACGPDIGVNEGNWDYAIVAEFDSVEDHTVYRDHPDHRAVIDTEVAAIRAERVAVQYEC
jgi:hypothetical protein